MGVTSMVRKAGKVAMKAVGAEGDEADQDLLTTLKTEHDEVKKLLKQLEKAEGTAERRSLVREIKAALVPHTKAEERVLYAALIASRDKEAQTDGHEGALEHDLASKTLLKLDSIAGVTTPEHLGSGLVLRELVEHHIQEEESNVWKDAKKQFSTQERTELNRRYLAQKARVKVP